MTRSYLRVGALTFGLGLAAAGAWSSMSAQSVDDTAKVVESLQKAFPDIRPPRKDDICYATTNRQNAVKEIAPQVDVFIVVGSKASSNANRLREVAERLGARAYLVDDREDLDPSWFATATRVGVTAGASTPEHLVAAVIERVSLFGAYDVVIGSGEPESIVFRLPANLIDTALLR